MASANYALFLSELGVLAVPFLAVLPDHFGGDISQMTAELYADPNTGKVYAHLKTVGARMKQRF